MKIAIIQINPLVGDLDGNAEKILQAVKNIRGMNPDIIVTPELSLIGYPPKDILLLGGFLERCDEKLDELAQKIGEFYDGIVLVGTISKNWGIGKPIHNSAVVLHRGIVARKMHKTLLPTYGVFDEDRYFEPNKNRDNCFYVSKPNLDSVAIGVAICEDCWNDKDYWKTRLYSVDPVAKLMEGVERPAEILISMNASPFVMGKQKVREDMVRAMTKKYHIPVIYCNQVGGQDDIVFDGNSFAMNADGDIIGRLLPFKEDVIVIDTEDAVAEVSYTPMSAVEEAFHALVLGTRDYVKKTGFEKAVIGLSGGIDSALVAAIACAALGRVNVQGVLMPSVYSSEGSISDAVKLADNLGIQHTIIPIADIVTAFDRVFMPPLQDYTHIGLPGWNNPANVAEENIQARIRGTILMAFSNKLPKTMVLSTGNKSEMAVGYSTLYGDMCGGLDVLSDVPKELVYDLARWYNEEYKKVTTIPQNTIDKAPSAELRPDQKDSDSLPPYPVLDTILEEYIVNHKNAEMIQAETSYPIETITKVLSMVTYAEYKRKQAPPGIKITDTAFGVGWRMPTTCKFRR